MTLFSALPLILLVSFVIGTPYDGCVFDITDVNGVTATYDLTWFQRETGVFEVDDYETDFYAYKFNICGHIHSPEPWNNLNVIPETCHPSHNNSMQGPCADIVNETCVSHSFCSLFDAQASAVQIDYSQTPVKCHWLGMELYNDNCAELNAHKFAVDLYDEENSAGGIVYSITNGEWCAAGGINRELRMSLVCPDMRSTTFRPMDEIQRWSEQVTESPVCVYRIRYETPLACPSTCVYQNGESFGVCNSHGICVSDPNVQKIKCLCDEGWTGDTCHKSTSDVLTIDSAHQSLQTAIIVCGVLTFIAMLIALYLWYVLKQDGKNKDGGGDGEANDGMFARLDDEYDDGSDEEHRNVKRNNTSINNNSSEHRQKVTRDTFNSEVSVDSDVQRDVEQQMQVPADSVSPK